jgi:hypothetical protein
MSAKPFCPDALRGDGAFSFSVRVVVPGFRQLAMIVFT